MPLRKRRLVIAAFGITSLFIFFLTFEQSRRPAPRYTVTDLGVLPGYTQSEAVAINSQGDVLVSNTPPGPYSERACLYRGGKLHDLGTLPGARNIYALSVNSRDEVTGIASRGGGNHAFLYNNGKMQDLGTLPGFPTSEGRAINDRGEIAGSLLNFAASSGRTKSHAFLYRRGKMTDLGTPPGSSDCFAISINSAGDIFGYCRKIGSQSYNEPFKYDSRTEKITILVLPATYYTGGAIRVNNRGQMLGETETTKSVHTAILTGSIITDLGTLPGRDYSFGRAINNRGVAVGRSLGQSGGLAGYVNDHPLRFKLLLPLAQQITDEHAFVYENGKMQDLNDLIPGNADWTLEEARSINDAGQIVGQGLHHGQMRTFLLTPVR